MFFRILNLLFPFLNIAYLYYINLVPGNFLVSTILFAGFNILFLVFVLFKTRKNSKAFVNFLNYLLFIISSISFFIFIKSDVLKVIIYFIVFLVSFLAIMHVRYLTDKNKENYFLVDIGFYMFLLSSFLATASLFALNIFLGLNKFLLTLVSFVYFFVLYFCIYYYYSKNIKDIYKYIFGSSLITSEAFAVVSFLPYSFYVDAIIVLLINFVVSILTKEYLLNKFSDTYFKRVFLIFFVLLFVILITAKRV